MGNVNSVGHSRTNQFRGWVAGARVDTLKSSEGSHGWDEHSIQRLLVEGKIAPRGSGGLVPGKHGSMECPICFLYFGVMNHSTCCHQPICTECYLKIRPPRRGAAGCPFCSKDGFTALVCRDESTELLTAQPATPHDPPAVARAYPKPTSSPRSLKVLPQWEETRITKATVCDEEAACTPVLSVDDRVKLEEQMRAQLDESRRRGDSAPAPPPAVSREGSRSQRRLIGGGGGGIGVMLAHGRNRGDNNLTLEDVHALLHSLPTDLQHVEELMVLEAMQASLDDEERRQREAAAEADNAAPASSPDEAVPPSSIEDMR